MIQLPYKTFPTTKQNQTSPVFFLQRMNMKTSSIHATLGFSLYSPKPYTKIPSHYINYSQKINKNPRKPCMKTLKCTPNSEDGGGESLIPDAEKLQPIVEEEVKKLLSTEENQKLLRSLQDAVKRVENAKGELGDVQEQENSVNKMKEYVEKLEGTESMIRECLKDIAEAQQKMRESELALISTRAGSRMTDNWEMSDIDKNAERLESVKAAAVSAIVGMLASIPLALFQAKSMQGLIIEEGIVFISCALFGVTYRYIVRQNIENTHLKSGAVAAFGLIRGLSQFKGEFPLEDGSLLTSQSIQTAFAVGESLLAFMFAAISLDYCMKADLLSSFPLRKKISS